MPEKQFVQATETTFALIDALLTDGPAGVTTLAERLDSPKSTVHKHLSTLSALGYVSQEGTDYQLTLGFAGLGLRARHAHELYRDVKLPINQLAESTEEHAGVYLATGTTGYSLYSTRGQRALLDDADYEPVPALHCHAPGKAILAQLTTERLEVIVQEGLPAYTQDTITSGSALRKEIHRVRERGVAFDRGEQHETGRSAARPIDLPEFDAAVYVTGPLDRMRGKRLEENIPDLLSNTAKQIQDAVHET